MGLAHVFSKKIRPLIIGFGPVSQSFAMMPGDGYEECLILLMMRGRISRKAPCNSVKKRRLSVIPIRIDPSFQ